MYHHQPDSVKDAQLGDGGSAKKDYTLEAENSRDGRLDNIGIF